MNYYKCTDANEEYVIKTKRKIEGLRTIEKEEYDDFVNSIIERSKIVYEIIQNVLNGKISIQDVPSEYYDYVYEVINQSEPEQLYTLDEAAAIIASEVAGNE